ncbi:TFIIH complex subunit TFB6 [Sugiyamaella lignohabitans]|uniref:TFIIH complex subunit TFB6 n=1 Tax=Sugiyamaella lignohabitans TaxID=796027 RepID=A0A167DVD3_9ASCO|nr:TFIIH complex subunit TFB6 [Sugiyamaella lignohabitans]ANB13339.1 TFIIH complex subunit TFB6 [Sugiyamaella lignohabitans]
MPSLDNSNESTNIDIDEVEEDSDEEPLHSSIPPREIPSWNTTRRPLSEAQQLKFRTYLDEELMRINGKYIHRLNEPSRGYASLKELIDDLEKVVDLVWYSITTTTNAPDTNSHTSYQTYYLLRIADDFVDYIEGYESDPSPVEMIQFVQKLDAIFTRLLDPQAPTRLTRTDAVRLTSIAERTRIQIAKSVVRGYEMEISQIYSSVLSQP